MTPTRDQRRRLEALERQDAAALEAQVYAFTTALARAQGALTAEEWFRARPLYARDAATPAELALVARVEALETASGATALCAELERRMGREELASRRDAVIRAVWEREAAGLPLSDDDRTILAGDAPFDELCRRATDAELDALAEREDEREDLIQALARTYGFLSDNDAAAGDVVSS